MMRWARDSCTAMARRPPQFGESDQQQAQAVVGVHAVVGEQSQILEHFISEVVGFVDDEYRALFGLQGEARDFGADDAEGRCARALGGQSQLPADGFIHIHDVAGGQGDIEDSIEARVQCGGDLAAHRGLSGYRLHR